MKNLFAFCLVVFISCQSVAQIGLVAGAKTFSPKDWNERFHDNLGDAPYPMGGWELGLDYWFRLKKRRIEFAPAITIARFNRDFKTSKLEHLEIGLHFNTDFYLFDMASDCNCPTFSKHGNIFTKGFFLEVSPGAVFLQNNNKASTGSASVDFNGDEITFGGSIGTGLDIGFSDLFTVTPLARYHLYPKTDWNYSVQLANFSTNLSQLFIGLRLRLHFKEISKVRYR